MAIKLTFGSKIVTIPQNGASPAWGQGIVAAFQAIADQLRGIVSTFDIPPSVQALEQDSYTNFPVLNGTFPSDRVRSFTFNYSIYKVNTVKSIVESGTVRGMYDTLNSAWILTHVFSGARILVGNPAIDGTAYNTFSMVGDALTLSTLPLGGAYNALQSKLSYSAKVILAKDI